MIYRLILTDWAKEEFPNLPKVLEGEFTEEQVREYNSQFYNVYWFPNYPSFYDSSKNVDGPQIDTFTYVFVDMDLKSGTYAEKKDFISALLSAGLDPSFIIDSGNGVHAYWHVSDLDPLSYVRLQRRLCRKFKTDEAVGKICQLMRAPDSINTKDPNDLKECKIVASIDATYTCEQLDAFLPRITPEDEAYCKRHYDQTYNVPSDIKIDDTIPLKFTQLLRNNKEVKEIWTTSQDDRSKADFRLAHIMFAEGLNKDDALSVLVNCQKALQRAPMHRHTYALNIVEKIWTFDNTQASQLSSSVKDILRKTRANPGTKLRCWEVYDGTDNGFRLTQVLGLIGPSGGGKTTLALNYFYWFAKYNPEYTHLFVSLEQPEEEIAIRWQRLTQGNEAMYDKVHVLSNYNEDGTYRNLSLSDIEAYIIDMQKRLEIKIGCVVIDHIGVLKKKSKEGESQGLIDICHTMKAVAKSTNTFLVMQSQTSREKAGIGDLELDKDAAFGTSMFENYCDYVVTTWQPLKRIYPVAPHMTCSTFKYCKIRHKNVLKDNIKEDVVYALMFDPETELLREMTEKDEVAYEHYSTLANRLRNKDKKREPTAPTKIDWTDKATKDKDAKNKYN